MHPEKDVFQPYRITIFCVVSIISLMGQSISRYSLILHQPPLADALAVPVEHLPSLGRLIHLWHAQHVMSSPKPEVDNVSQCHQRGPSRELFQYN